MHIIAEKVIKLISAKKSIEIAAKEEILITAGGSYIRINKAGIEEGTPGQWKAWAADHDLPEAKSLPYKMPRFEGDFSNRLDVYNLFISNKMSDITYKVLFDDKRTQEGTLDIYGRTTRIYSKKPESVKILVGGKNWLYMAKQVQNSKQTSVTIEDMFNKPLSGLKIEAKQGGTTVFKGETDGQGKVTFANQPNELIDLYVEQFIDGSMTELLKLRPSIEEVVLISPKITMELELKADGEAGNYWRGIHEVASGETYASIAKSKGVFEPELAELNDYIELKAGDEIKLPIRSSRKA
jgi:type VI secretion system secreted protein VgrG